MSDNAAFAMILMVSSIICTVIYYIETNDQPTPAEYVWKHITTVCGVQE